MCDTLVTSANCDVLCFLGLWIRVHIIIMMPMRLVFLEISSVQTACVKRL